MKELTRRAKAARWIAGLHPFLHVISVKVDGLGLGEPRLEVGPTFMPGKIAAEDRIRKGAVWFVTGNNCGFHVDFYVGGIEIVSWNGADRRSTTRISGKVTEGTLRKDLTVSFVAAGLTDLARTEEVRAQLFTRTARN